MPKVSFLVDGFNLYHSICDALTLKTAAGSPLYVSLKWLDLKALCRSYLQTLGREAELDTIYYFTSYQEYLQQRKPDVIRHHRAYVEALEAMGVHVTLGRFGVQAAICRACGDPWNQRQEKKTDVAIACKLLELFVRQSCEVAVIVSGDTDLVPAVETVIKLFPNAKIVAAFPHNRHNAEMARVCHAVYKIKPERYAAHQLPLRLTGRRGNTITKPPDW